MQSFKYIPLLGLLLFISACNKEDGGSVSRDFFENSALEINNSNENSPNLLLTEGDQYVFRYAFNHPEEADIADDELTEVFWFQVPKGQSEFEYQLSGSTAEEGVTLAYQRLCFCGPVSYEITEYSIQGTQVSQNEWRIKFSMKARDDFDTTYPLKDEGNYRLTTN